MFVIISIPKGTKKCKFCIQIYILSTLYDFSCSCSHKLFSLDVKIDLKYCENSNFGFFKLIKPKNLEGFFYFYIIY